MLDFLAPQDHHETEERQLKGKPSSFGIHRYLQGSANLFEENRLLKVAIIGLFGITAVLGLLIYTSNQNQRTVVVPFGAGGDLYVTGNKPSEGYLRTVTRNIAASSLARSAPTSSRSRLTMRPPAPATLPASSSCGGERHNDRREPSRLRR